MVYEDDVWTETSENRDRELAAKEFLRAPVRCEREIERMHQRISYLRARVSSINARLKPDRVRSSPDPTQAQRLMAEIVDLEREIPLYEQRRDEALEEVSLALSRLPEQFLTDIMEMRYLRGMQWREIENEVCYSYAWLMKLHSRALAMLEFPGSDEI